MERDLAGRYQDGICSVDEWDDVNCNIAPALKVQIENILKRADQEWPIGMDNNHVNFYRNSIIEDLGRKARPVIAFSDFLKHFMSLDDGNFKAYREIIMEISGIIIDFSMDFWRTLKGSHKVGELQITMTGKNFDAIVDHGLAIEHSKEFLNDNGQYRYCQLISDYLTNAKSKTKLNEADHIAKEAERLAARRNLYAEFRIMSHQQRFTNGFNATARVYRSPKHRATLKKLAEIVDFVRTCAADPPDYFRPIPLDMNQKAKMLISEINYKIFDGMPTCSGYVDNIKKMLNIVTKNRNVSQQDTKDLKMFVGNYCDAWNPIAMIPIQGYLRYRVSEFEGNSFTQRLKEISERDLTIYRDFLQK